MNAEICRSLDLHPLSGFGVLGSGWPIFEQDERELGARVAYGLNAEALDPGAWLFDLQYAAYCAGVPVDEILTRVGQERLRNSARDGAPT